MGIAGTYGGQRQGMPVYEGVPREGAIGGKPHKRYKEYAPAVHSYLYAILHDAWNGI